MLLLKRHLSVDIVTTAVYPQMVEYVLANQAAGDSGVPYYLQVYYSKAIYFYEVMQTDLNQTKLVIKSLN